MIAGCVCYSIAEAQHRTVMLHSFLNGCIELPQSHVVLCSSMVTDNVVRYTAQPGKVMLQRHTPWKGYATKYSSYFGH